MPLWEPAFLSIYLSADDNTVWIHFLPSVMRLRFFLLYYEHKLSEFERCSVIDGPFFFLVRYTSVFSIDKYVSFLLMSQLKETYDIPPP